MNKQKLHLSYQTHLVDVVVTATPTNNNTLVGSLGIIIVFVMAIVTMTPSTPGKCSSQPKLLKTTTARSRGALPSFPALSGGDWLELLD